MSNRNYVKLDDAVDFVPLHLFLPIHFEIHPEFRFKSPLSDAIFRQLDENFECIKSCSQKRYIVTIDNAHFLKKGFVKTDSLFEVKYIYTTCLLNC